MSSFPRLLPLLALVVAGGLVSPALADDWHRDHDGPPGRAWGWREREWRQHERWEHRNDYIRPPVVVAAPPAAVYVPPPAVVMAAPAPGINIVLPISIR